MFNLCSYKFTCKSFSKLKKKNLPSNIIKEFKQLEGQEYPSKESFIEHLRDIISEKELDNYKSIILDKTKIYFSTKTILLLMISGVFFITVAYAVFLICITWPISDKSIIKAGVFGDSFGILTALFSGLAFSGLIGTILLQKKELFFQRKELELQRKELKITRQEFEKQTKQFEKQSETFIQQTFENTFFQLIVLHTDFVNNIPFKGMNFTEERGRKYFKKLNNEIIKAINGDPNYNNVNKKTMTKMFSDQLSDDQNNINLYIQNICNLYEFIEHSTTKNPELYMKIFLSQLSLYEREFLIYYGSVDEKIKHLIIAYSIPYFLPKNYRDLIETYFNINEFYPKNATERS